MYSKAGLPAAPHQGLGPALEYERVRFEEASDALEDDHRLPTPQNSCPPIAEQPLWWIYRHPGEAKYTVILIYPAAHQDSSPVSGREALFVLFLSSGLLPLRRYQVPGEKGEGGHEQPGVGHGDLSRHLQVIRQDYRDGHTYTPAPRSGCKNLSRRSDTARGRWPPPCLLGRHRRHGGLLRLRPRSPRGLRYRG